MMRPVLANVLPYFSAQDVADKRSGNSKLSGEFGFLPQSDQVFGSNHANQSIGQLCFRMLLALVVPCWSLMVSSATLCHAIVNIISMGSNKKMLRIKAFFIVAVVAHAFSFWYRTVAHFKHQPVGHWLFSSYSDFSVSAWFNGAGPVPTSVWSRLVNPFPEPSVKGFHQLFSVGNSRFTAYLSSCHTGYIIIDGMNCPTPY
jgi:hypothetical protein